MQYKSYKYRKGLIKAFLDMETAYDSVRRNKVWEILRSKGIASNIIERVKKMCKDS